MGFATVECTVPPQSKRFKRVCDLFQFTTVDLDHLGNLPDVFLVRESTELANVDPLRRLVLGQALVIPPRFISVFSVCSSSLAASNSAFPPTGPWPGTMVSASTLAVWSITVSHLVMWPSGKAGRVLLTAMSPTNKTLSPG